MPALDLAGVALHYDSTGDGPPLVLVHGSAVDSTTWHGVVPDLARDYRVITYDRRGYGQSAHKPVRDHRLHARDLAAVLEQVAVEPAVVVGWSAGGNVALAVAAKRPEAFRSLVVVEAPFHGLRHMDVSVLRTLVRLKGYQLRGRPVAALEEFLRFGSALRSGGNTYDRADEQTRKTLRRYPQQVLAEWDPHPFGVMHEHVPVATLKRIPVPITWILGGESSPWMAGLQERVSRACPDIKTVVVPGASHLVHVDRPEGFIAAVRETAGPQPLRAGTVGVWPCAKYVRTLTRRPKRSLTEESASPDEASAEEEAKSPVARSCGGLAYPPRQSSPREACTSRSARPFS